jgi:DNA-binding GntR family transcriptional regulator
MLSAAQSLRNSIGSELRRRIIEGDCALGARLSENVLALELGVSRTPVREALMALQDEGLVEVRPQRGTYVFSIDAEETRQLCDLRGILEVGALQLALERQGDRLITRMKDILKTAKAVEGGGSLRKSEQLDRAFHESLIEASGNRFLIDSYQRIAGRVNALRFRLPANRSRVSRALAEHQKLIVLLESGLLGEAIDLLRLHVKNVSRQLSESAKSA